MIRVTVVLDCARGAHRDRVLAAVEIVNDGTGTPSSGNYVVRARRLPRGKLRTARVTNFPRKSRGALELLRRGLDALATAGQL